MSIKQPDYSIPMSSPDITDAEREAVAKVMRTTSLSMGKEIQDFEQDFAEYTGTRNIIGVNSGTAGLHLCVRGLGIGDSDTEQRDLVITTPFSFVASTNVLLFERAVPVFVDVDSQTGNIDVEQVQDAAQALMQGGPQAQKWLPRRGVDRNFRLKAILPVDVFGQPADMQAINSVANKWGLNVIEDSCEALGAEYQGKLAGTLGDCGVFAFYPNKQITTGEGAVVITDDDQLAEIIRTLRNQGRAPGDTWLQHTYLGYNYRLDELSSAVGKVQLARIEELLAKRQQVADWYTERLVQLEGVEVPQVVSTTTRMSWFVYVIRFHASHSRDEIAAKLGEYNIPARPYFLPIHLQPYMVERFSYHPGDFPITEDLGQRSLALPFSSVMDEEQVEHVCNTLRSVLN